jgi:hypothetical protein
VPPPSPATLATCPSRSCGDSPTWPTCSSATSMAGWEFYTGRTGGGTSGCGPTGRSAASGRWHRPVARVRKARRTRRCSRRRAR